ncbi:MAG: GntR family transcriptional regulator [Rubrivivax sp.]|nr:GntR family transcriptional regulator [Rubrivivax sp.]
MSARLPLPKYHQVYLVLREQLQEGRFADGLPGELALAGQFGVARVTVRKALEQLAGEGLIERAPGRGTTPRPRTAETQRSGGARLTGLLENIVNVGLRTSVKVLACATVPAGAEVAAALQIAPGTPVQQARRVRSTGLGPLSLITTHVPAALARGFGARELARKPLLVLLEESGVHIGSAVQTISAQLADAPTARHLDVPVGSALLAVTRLVRDGDERPVQWLHGLYRPDRYQYSMQLSRVGSIDAKLWVSTELSAQFH